MNEQMLQGIKRYVGFELHLSRYYLCIEDVSDTAKLRYWGSLASKKLFDRLSGLIQAGDFILLQDEHEQTSVIQEFLLGLEAVVVQDASQFKPVKMAKRGRAMATELSRRISASLKVDDSPSIAKRLLQVGLYMKEVVRRTDLVQSNIEHLLQGKDVEKTIKKAMDLEYQCRTPLTVEGMKVPKQAYEMQTSYAKLDDDTFLSEYQGVLDEIKDSS